MEQDYNRDPLVTLPPPPYTVGYNVMEHSSLRIYKFQNFFTLINFA